MLSEQELRQLREIERQVHHTDPRLAASLSTMCVRRCWSVPLAICGWAAFAAIAVTDWWPIAVLMFGPLIPVTLSALAWLTDSTEDHHQQPHDPLS